MNNLEIYNKYRQVPAEALKTFDNGNFKGTDINSMWRVKCLTEQFGVVGHGWTTRVLRVWLEKCEYTNEVYAFAEIEMQVKIGEDWGKPFTATGGNKFCTYVKSKDYYKGSDEAFKMAITDAFGVACKYLGIGADVYWANDKSKYTEEPKKDVPFEEIKKEMTLDAARQISIVGKDGKVHRVKDMTEEELLYLKDYKKRPDLMKACQMELDARNENHD